MGTFTDYDSSITNGSKTPQVVRNTVAVYVPNGLTYMKTITTAMTTATPARSRITMRMGTTIAATGVATPGELVVVAGDCVHRGRGGGGGKEHDLHWSLAQECSRSSQVTNQDDSKA